MWPWDNKMPAFRGLSYFDRWRVGMCLLRGEAPEDSRLAAGAVDLAEGYGRESRVRKALMLLYVPLVLAWLGYVSISAASEGDRWALILYVVVVAMGIANLLLDPRWRPKKVARSLEASRHVLAASAWDPSSTAQPAGAGGSTAATGWYPDPRSSARERLWDGGDWTSWVRPVQEGRVEADPAGWQPHPSRPAKEMLWSGNGWTDRERDAADSESVQFRPYRATTGDLKAWE